MSFYLKHFYLLFLSCQLMTGFLQSEGSLQSNEGFLSFSPPFLQQNEFLKFKITYLGITGGYSTLEVIHDEHDKKILHLKLKAWTTPFVSAFYKLDMELNSIVGKKKLQTLHYSEYKLEKRKLRQHKIVVEPQKKQFSFYDNLTNSQPNNIIAFNDRGYDTLASFYLSRCVDFTSREKLMFSSFFRNKIFKTTVFNAGQQQIKHKWGRGKTTKIIPKMEFRGLFVNTGDITIYLSDDEYRIPLLMTSKLSVGEFKAILIERKSLSTRDVVQEDVKDVKEEI